MLTSARGSEEREIGGHIAVIKSLFPLAVTSGEKGVLEEAVKRSKRLLDDKDSSIYIAVKAFLKYIGYVPDRKFSLFLGAIRQFKKDIVIRSIDIFINKDMKSRGMGIDYLIGIMRNERIKKAAQVELERKVLPNVPPEWEGD